MLISTDLTQLYMQATLKTTYESRKNAEFWLNSFFLWRMEFFLLVKI
jgi:hypothetical protein